MEETLYEGRYLRVTTERRDNHEIERVYVRDGVSIIPLVSADGGYRIRCIREFDPVQQAVRTKLVSGWMEDGESPLACAQRELYEELGLHAREWHAYHTATFEGAVVKKQYFFIAVISDLPVGGARPEPGEQILGCLDFTREGLREAVLRGDFGSTETAYVLLQYAMALDGSRP